MQIAHEVYRRHIAVTVGGVELASGGSRRVPRNVTNDKMRNWICDGLVIVFLTETLDGFDASFVAECCRRQEAEREKRRVVASTQAEELAIHPFPEILLAELQQEVAYRSESRVLKSESNGYS